MTQMLDKENRRCGHVHQSESNCERKPRRLRSAFSEQASCAANAAHHEKKAMRGSPAPHSLRETGDFRVRVANHCSCEDGEY
jgi:hypothetical protein